MLKPLPRQFQPRHRRPLLTVKPVAVSAVVLSATLLASGSAGHSATAGAPRPPAAAPAAPAPLFAEDASLVLSQLDGQASLSDAPAPAPAAPPPPARPRPVAGLNQTQMNNAAAIVRQGRAQGMPEKGLVVAVATAMQESDLYNVASPAVPSSMKLPHDAVSTDHDSVGLFQQRASQGWGSVAELMDPAHSAALFYSALARVSGWQNMSVTAAAQAVQRSAYPGAYQKHADRAAQVVAAIA
ncbi:hypothetical protein ACQP1P_40900 [Dactylosporangium sp. CA-052675]|uniref:hypothetical protein n=1 Tax=Dactylosporangium sp. CA-052675 TaxID=3239927 RepID=UPI003D92ED85